MGLAHAKYIIERVGETEMKLHIINPNTSTQMTEMIRRSAEQAKSAGTELLCTQLDHGPFYANCAYDNIAVSYEMEMCYSDCEVIQTYTMENSRFSVPAGRDDKNVTGCCRGRKIRVRAIDADGNAGKWSDYDTVGCNAIRG